MKKYLLIGANEFVGIQERYLQETKHSLNWVEDPKKATAKSEEAAAKAIQDDLTELGIKTELEEMKYERQLRWVIYKED